MLQDNKHNDKKWQELENQSLPDLSRMDEHWQQMKTLLQPEILPAGKINGRVGKYFRVVIAAAFIGGIFFIGYYIISRNKSKGSATGNKIVPVLVDSKTSAGNKLKVSTQRDSIVLSGTSDITRGNERPNNFPSKNLSKKTGWEPLLSGNNQRLNPGIKLNDTASASSKLPGVETKPRLDDFFKDLEKASQQFTINNKRDTVLTGKDGTALLIPASTFDCKDDVIITLKEFYSYQDIVTNKLATLSDGRQLISGGMIHIMATVNGKETDIQPGKSIQWFIPDTTEEMKQMQLFTGTTVKRNRQSATKDGEQLTGFFYGPQDSLKGSGSLEVMNWVPDGRFFTTESLVKKVKVLYIPNEPFRTKDAKKGTIGFFELADKPKISREQLQDELKDKYGYYKVKIKNRPKDNFFTRLTYRLKRWRHMENFKDIGDSAWINSDMARRFRLPATDSVTYIQKSVNYSGGNYSKRTFNNINLDNLANRFSVDIRTLGWINCDKFYKNGGPRIDYYVDMKDTASSYYTLLVFDKIKSMMQGIPSGNKIIFYNVPQGESAKVISVGVLNGKTVAAMENVQISRTILSGLKFEDTNPTLFKERAAIMDK